MNRSSLALKHFRMNPIRVFAADIDLGPILLGELSARYGQLGLEQFAVSVAMEVTAPTRPIAHGPPPASSARSQRGPCRLQLSSAELLELSLVCETTAGGGDLRCQLRCRPVEEPAQREVGEPVGAGHRFRYLGKVDFGSAPRRCPGCTAQAGWSTV